MRMGGRGKTVRQPLLDPPLFNSYKVFITYSVSAWQRWCPKAFSQFMVLVPLIFHMLNFPCTRLVCVPDCWLTIDKVMRVA